MKQEILEKVNKKFNKNISFGKVLNYLQDVAEKGLNEKDFEEYLVLANKDVKKLDGQDGMLLNGHYFDWREFEHKRDDIVLAWLSYFSTDSLTKINEVL